MATAHVWEPDSMKGKSNFVMILVGRTCSGKSAFIDYLCNDVLRGEDVTIIEDEEAPGSGMEDAVAAGKLRLLATYQHPCQVLWTKGITHVALFRQLCNDALRTLYLLFCKTWMTENEFHELFADNVVNYGCLVLDIAARAVYTYRAPLPSIKPTSRSGELRNQWTST